MISRLLYSIIKVVVIAFAIFLLITIMQKAFPSLNNDVKAFLSNAEYHLRNFLKPVKDFIGSVF